jgi:hypothetical protein
MHQQLLNILSSLAVVAVVVGQPVAVAVQVVIGLAHHLH